MKRIAIFTGITLAMVAEILTIAVLWCYLNQTRRFQGPLLFILWSTHGVHLFDVLILGIELVLITLLTGILIAGFFRSH